MAKMVVFKRIKETAFISFLLSMIVHIGTSFIVRREVDPTFVPTPSNVTVHEGDLAVLKCHIERLGPKMVVWRKLEDDYPLTIGTMTFGPGDEMTVDHSKLSKSSSTWDLHIKNVKAHHAGVYECQVTANHLIAQYVTLNVLKQAAVKSTLQVTGKTFVSEGETLHLECKSSDGPTDPMYLQWFYDDVLLHETSRIQILKHSSTHEPYVVSELIIDNIKLSDEGYYICRNSFLSKTETVAVRVELPRHRGVTNIGGEDVLHGNSQYKQTAFEKKYVIRGDRIYLRCEIVLSESWDYTLKWFFEDRRIRPMDDKWRDRVNITTNTRGRVVVSDFEILKSDMGDNGDYICLGPDNKINEFNVHVLSDPSVRDPRQSEQHGKTRNSSPNLYPQYTTVLIIWTFGYTVIK